MGTRVEGFDEFKRQSYSAASSLDRYVQSAFFNIGSKVTADARRRAPVGVSSPGLKKAIKFKQDRRTLLIFTDERVPHAAAVEFGSKPHFPPVKAITGREEMLDKWARIKLGDPTAAFLIARKISKVGTKAQPFMIPAFENNKRYADRQFSNVGGKLVQEIVK